MGAIPLFIDSKFSISATLKGLISTKVSVGTNFDILNLKEKIKKQESQMLSLNEGEANEQMVREMDTKKKLQGEIN